MKKNMCQPSGLQQKQSRGNEPWCRFMQEACSCWSYLILPLFEVDSLWLAELLLQANSQSTFLCLSGRKSWWHDNKDMAEHLKTDGE